jgi:DNA-binding NarL/FixJ family response regulator
MKVLIVEDQKILAEALSLALAEEPDIEVVGVAHDSASAIRMASALAPDVVVMDYILPDGDGVAATRAIHRARPDLPVVMLTGDTSDEVMLAALNAGLSGFLTKDAAVENLASVLRRAAEGEMLWPAERLALLLRQSRGSAKTGRDDGDLTTREREVLRLMAQGLDNKTIAHNLQLSVATVRGHVQRILAKLGAHSKLEAVVIASRKGLIKDLA